MAKHIIVQGGLLVCVYLSVHWIQLVSCAPRHGEKDFYVTLRHPKEDEKFFPNSNFPRNRQCKAVTRHKERNERGFIDAETTLWSPLLDVFLIPNENIITKTEKKVMNEVSGSFEYWKVGLGIPLFIICGIFVACVSTLFIPVVGSFVFFLCEHIYYVLTHRCIRRIGRRILIWKELNRRKFELALIKRSGIRRKPPRPKFRMPKFFRNMSDEDIPIDLQKPHGDDLESKSSSDEFTLESAFNELEEQEERTKELARLLSQRRIRLNRKRGTSPKQRPRRGSYLKRSFF